MLIEFKFGNFRSFRDETTLSLIAAEALNGNSKLDEKNIFAATPNLNLLRVATIYGANASGKSNVVRAFETFRRTIRESTNSDFNYEEPPFFLDMDSKNQPTWFEITFLMGDVRIRYGFEIQTGDVIAYPKQSEKDVDSVVSEWLYRFEPSDDSEVMLFERKNSLVEVNGFSEVELLLDDNAQFLRPESLLLSVGGQIPRNKVIGGITKFFDFGFMSVSGIYDEHLRTLTQDIIRTENSNLLSRISTLLQQADTGIVSVGILEPNHPALADAQGKSHEFDELRVVTEHPVTNNDGLYSGITAVMPLFRTGSEGTKKLFAFSGPITIVLELGLTLFVDEMDARFHPLLTRAIIELFQSPETNPKNAQLVFVTHDTNLLDPKMFRRDQIFFVEKDRYNVSHLYSLADLKVSDNENFEENYMQGRYGAIPFLGGVRKLKEALRNTNQNGNDQNGTGVLKVDKEPVHA